MQLKEERKEAEEPETEYDMEDGGNSTAASTIGFPGSFDPNIETWANYMLRFNLFTMLNSGIDDTKKALYLLTSLGPTTIQTLSSIVAPTELSTLSVQTINEKMSAHFTPYQSTIAHRFKFWSRGQQPDEPIRQYSSAIRQLSLLCQFGDNLDEMLRDKFVFGLCELAIQKSLLAQDKLTFSEAEQRAASIQAADQNARAMQGEKSAFSEQAVRKDQRHGKKPLQSAARSHRDSLSSEDEECGKCGFQSHISGRCPAKNSHCNGCGVKGHYSRRCPDKKKRANQVAEYGTSDSEEPLD